MPWAFILLLLSLPARADNGCGWDGNHIDYDCGNGYGGGAAGASIPVLGDTLEGNPASLPVAPTPFGLEGRLSDHSYPDGKPKFSASTVKGFDGIGFGIGSWSDGEFDAPDFDNHFLGTVSDSAYRAYMLHPPSTLGLRLGTAVVLPKFLLGKYFRVSVGGSAGLGRVNHDYSPQVGVLVRVFSIFGIGASNNYEHIALTLPRATVTTLSFGIDIGPIYLGYSRIFMKSSSNSTNADVLGARVGTKTWTFYGSLKHQTTYLGVPDVWPLAGLQHRFGKRIGLGYEYGMYRHSHSAILQIFL